jgi:hypothetical protein
VDIDFDGDIDILTSGVLRITWIENLGGSPIRFLPKPIAVGSRGPIAADLDADGDLDLVSFSRDSDAIYWHENMGGSSGSFARHVVVQDPDGIFGPLEGFADGATSVDAADMDGDGDIDLLSASGHQSGFVGRLAWYENDGASPPSFRPHSLTMDRHDARLERVLLAEGARDVIAVDLDGDSDKDVAWVSFTSRDSKVAWHQNLIVLPDAPASAAKSDSQE